MRPGKAMNLHKKMIQFLKIDKLNTNYFSLNQLDFSSNRLEK